MPQGRSTKPVFSPDGQWLLVATSTEFGIWEAGTWRLVRQVPREHTTGVAGAAAFSSNSKVLAAVVSLTTVCRFDAETWRPLARLRGPDGDVIGRVEFTPDGAQLLMSFDSGALRLWDLRRVREQLAELGLDWNQPAYAPAPPAGDLKPVRVEVDVAAYERLAKADAGGKK